MSRIAYCPACAAAESGVKTRIALEHTCGLSDDEFPALKRKTWKKRLEEEQAKQSADKQRNNNIQLSDETGKSKSIHCTLTDAQLIAKADQWIDELIASGGKSWTMQIPARPNMDTDLILAETVNRYKALQAKVEKYEAALNDILKQLDYYSVIDLANIALSEVKGEKEVENG